MAERVSSRGAVERRSIWMYAEDWAEVDVLARVKGLNTSSALRVIIREWRDTGGPGSRQPARPACTWAAGTGGRRPRVLLDDRRCCPVPGW